jgi:GAF domain-containing protein
MPDIPSQAETRRVMALASATSALLTAPSVVAVCAAAAQSARTLFPAAASGGAGSEGIEVVFLTSATTGSAAAAAGKRLAELVRSGSLAGPVLPLHDVLSPDGRAAFSAAFSSSMAD